MDLHIVPIEALESQKTAVSPYVDSFVERANGRFDSEDVFERIKEGFWSLWIVHEKFEIRAVLMTQIIKYPKLKELQIIMCVGENHKDWYHLVNKMKDFARSSGCKKIVAITRPGWEKVMKEFEKSHVYLEGDL
jgi:ribosomal protein L5